MAGIDDDAPFSLVRGGASYRFQRAVGLIPADGLGIGRRLAVGLAITWLPVVVLAAIDRRLFEGTVPDPLLRHFGVHARCLVAIPMFLVAEAVVDRYLPFLVHYFATSGLVDAETLPRFRAVLRSGERLRDSRLGLAITVGLVVLSIGAAASSPQDVHEVAWAVDGSEGHRYLLAAGLWYLFVTRPIFLFLLVQWLWRLFILAAVLRAIAKLDLRLVPTHPDGSGGLGFLQTVPSTFAPVVLGISAVFAATLGHEVMYHEVHVKDLYVTMGSFVAIVVLIFLAPLGVFSANLRQLRRRGLLEYGALAGRQGRLVDDRWIRGKELGDQPLLAAPELGPVADVISMYEAVERIQPTPFRRGPVVAVAAAAALPLVAVLAIEVPVSQFLLKILQSLV